MAFKRKKLFLAMIILLILSLTLSIAVLSKEVTDNKGVKNADEKVKKESKKIVGSTKCKLCHIGMYFSWTKTTHYRGFRSSNLPSDFSECESCHGGGSKHVDALGNEDILVPNTFKEANQSCGKECHFNVQKLRKGIQIPIVNPQVWKKSNHGQAELSCVKCHSPHKNKEDINLQDNNFCLNCHNDEGPGTVLSKIEEHKSGEDCLTCHNPHGESLKSNEFTREYIHYPVAKNRCFDCHSTHMASGGQLTKKRNNELCYKCHNTKKYVYPDTIHAEAEGIEGKGLCINCHEPHSANYKPLLKREPTKMCRSCHYNKRPHHFLAIANTGNKVDCIDCHNPHGEANKALLKMKPNDICANCHDK